MKAIFLIVTIGLILVNWFVFGVQPSEELLITWVILIWIGAVLIDIRNKLK